MKMKVTTPFWLSFMGLMIASLVAMPTHTIKTWDWLAVPILIMILAKFFADWLVKEININAAFIFVLTTILALNFKSLLLPTLISVVTERIISLILGLFSKKIKKILPSLFHFK